MFITNENKINTISKMESKLKEEEREKLIISIPIDSRENVFGRHDNNWSFLETRRFLLSTMADFPALILSFKTT